MKLTPLDIHHKEFRRTVRGYNEEEVDIFLDEVAEEFERLFKENVEIKEKLEQIQEKVEQYQNIEQTLRNTLLQAQRSAEEVQINAKKEAELSLKDAELKAKELLQDSDKEKRNLAKSVNALRQAESEFRMKFKSLLESYLAMLGEMEKARERLDKKTSQEIAEETEKAIPVEIPVIEEKKSEEAVHPRRAEGTESAQEISETIEEAPTEASAETAKEEEKKESILESSETPSRRRYRESLARRAAEPREPFKPQEEEEMPEAAASERKRERTTEPPEHEEEEEEDLEQEFPSLLKLGDKEINIPPHLNKGKETKTTDADIEEIS